MEKELKNNYPLVVVNCLVYNHEPYLRDCLEGLLMQRTNFEYVIVVHDDASTDHSQEIIQEYASRNPNRLIPILEKENLYAQHREKLVEVTDSACAKTNAKYVAICEGDDYWIDPLKLQKQVDYMESHPECSLCGTNGFVFWEDYIKVPSYFNPSPVECDYSLRDLFVKWRLPTASLLYRIEVVSLMEEWNKGYFHGDQMCQLSAFTLGKIHYLPLLTCVYRYSKKNVTSTTMMVGSNYSWAVKEKMRLYHGFNQWTNGKYKKEVDEILSVLKEDEKFYHYWAIFKPLTLIVMPIYATRRIWKISKGVVIEWLSKK